MVYHLLQEAQPSAAGSGFRRPEPIVMGGPGGGETPGVSAGSFRIRRAADCPSGDGQFGDRVPRLAEGVESLTEAFASFTFLPLLGAVCEIVLHFLCDHGE